MTALAAANGAAEILEAWNANAAPWTTAIREQRIASRRRGTDQAIIDAVVDSGARHIVDIGCGEGWLCRALTARGVETIGVDAVPKLIEAAQSADPQGDYHVRHYSELATVELAGPVDAAVCNFSLLSEIDLDAVLAGARQHGLTCPSSTDVGYVEDGTVPKQSHIEEGRS